MKTEKKAECPAMKTDWKLKSGTLDYEWNGWTAKYTRTYGDGYAGYKILDPSGRVWGTGGLPNFVRVLS